jgi:hypothetical protein
MTIVELLDRLGYTKSDNYLSPDEWDSAHAVDFAHLFRRAAKKPCHLHGVYALRDGLHVVAPLVYVCDAASEADAKEIHRLVWNQDAVPFLIVNSPETVRVYPGFCPGSTHKRNPGLEAVLQTFNSADETRIVRTLDAAALDSGSTWKDWGGQIRPEYRVDWQLLGSIKKLDVRLQEEGLLREVSHALIGKYVYLHYLRDRNILSDRKLEKWKIPEDAAFGRNATVDGLVSLLKELNEWLNGDVFPIKFGSKNAPRDDHVAQVAATFKGDEPIGKAHWQLHLDFKAYDFSYIPIEVLSVVYQQFLHSSEPGGQDRGRSAGAYYTPIPVVNLMLKELEERRPLRRGMRVFDPACGSGAFLVQAFRRLIEKEFPNGQGCPSPVALRELLEGHFFGVDTDPDACSVTKLSLILTLLDYVDPPDLEPDARPGPKPPLPNLGQNIFRGNFFNDDESWRQAFANKKADWVVGNPPWKSLKGKNLRKEDKSVLAWIKAEKKQRPVGNLQAARAFAWRAAEFVSHDGEIAMLLPAMSLFEEAAKGFRKRFMERMQVRTVVNFSNMRRVISAGRFLAPAAAFLYQPRPPECEANGEETIRTYSPLVANQEATRSSEPDKHEESWSIVVNASEIRDLEQSAVASGQALPWKVAAWGSALDLHLMNSLSRKFPTLLEMAHEGHLMLSEGPQLREGDIHSPPEGFEAVPDLLGKNLLDFDKLVGVHDIFALPVAALKPNKRGLLRIRGGKAGIEVCNGPHVLVSATRNFAVYNDDMVIVSSRQIGIASPAKDKDLLKAISLFLSSDFAFYFEFFASTEFGVERDVSTLKALRKIPTPLANMKAGQLKPWVELHDKLAKATLDKLRPKGLFPDDHSASAITPGSVVGEELIAELNSLVNEALQLKPLEKELIRDFVRIRWRLNNGGTGIEAVRKPTKSEMLAYGDSLRAALDDYIKDVVGGAHEIQIMHDDYSGMVRLALVSNASGRRVAVVSATAGEARALKKCRENLRVNKSQWLYFDRNLRVYGRKFTYILKPMQRFHWTKTQATVDAMKIVTESIARKDTP